MSKFIKIIGFLVTLISLFFVFEKIWANRLWILNWRPTWQIVIVIAVGSIAYAMNCFLLSLAWQRLLIWFGQRGEDNRECHMVYARTQIAKYIPGNIFHFAGRHALGRHAGFNHGPLVGAAVYEVAGLIAASGAIAFMGLLLLRSDELSQMLSKVVSIILAMLFFLFLFHKISYRLSLPVLRALSFPKKNVVEIMSGLLPPYLAYLGFFLIAGGILVGIVSTRQYLENISQVGGVIAIFAISWIAGFVTPGAPAGVGVREAIMIAYLSKFIETQESLVIVLLFRIVTVVGDALFFLASFSCHGSLKIRTSDMSGN